MLACSGDSKVVTVLTFPEIKEDHTLCEAALEGRSGKTGGKHTLKDTDTIR